MGHHAWLTVKLDTALDQQETCDVYWLSGNNYICCRSMYECCTYAGIRTAIVTVALEKNLYTVCHTTTILSIFHPYALIKDWSIILCAGRGAAIGPE